MNVDKIRLHHMVKDTIAVQYTVKSAHEVCTYLLLDTNTGLTKIGRTTNLKQRIITLNNIQKTNLVLMHVTYRDVEVAIHHAYKHKVITNEWFKLSLLDYESIKEIFP